MIPDPPHQPTVLYIDPRGFWWAAQMKAGCAASYAQLLGDITQAADRDIGARSPRRPLRVARQRHTPSGHILKKRRDPKRCQTSIAFAAYIFQVPGGIK